MTRLYYISVDTRQRCVPYGVAQHLLRRYMIMWRLHIVTRKPEIIPTDMWEEV